jgi:hypothetical protein
MRATHVSLLTALGALTVLGGAALAHHSNSAYDVTRQLAVTGTVKEFKWANPHCWLYLQVPDGKGGSDTYAFEGGSVSVLARNGWHADSIKKGMHVRLVIHPNKDGSKGGSFESVRRDDGQVFAIGVI